MKKLETYERPLLILCEGAGDKYVLDKLTRLHGLNGLYHSAFPTIDDDPGGGRSKLGMWLETRMETSPTFRDNVKAVLIVSDSDEDQAGSFKEITKQLKKINNCPVPTKPQEFINGKPISLAILMIPIAGPGNLETLCVTASYAKWPYETALDAYVAATPAGKWKVGKQSKMRMQALLAATCDKRPEANLANVFQLAEEYHVPVNGPVFDGVVAYLKEFAQVAGAM